MYVMVEKLEKYFQYALLSVVLYQIFGNSYVIILYLCQNTLMELNV